MNNNIYISKNYRHIFTATAKAKMDVEYILKNNGWRNIGLPLKNIENEKIGRLWTALSNLLAYIRMPHSGQIFLQYPINFSHLQIRRASKRRNKVIVLIHDLNSIRDEKDNKDFEYLKYADTIIVHNQYMKDWLLRKGVQKEIQILGIFDYLKSDYVAPTPKFPIKVCFAGNLAKSMFLSKVKFHNIQLKLFGIGGDKITLNEGVEYQGCFHPSQLAEHLHSHFGLVWDGDSANTCTGILGEYLKLNSPHKLSMYLSAGIPVIVWKQSAMATFVRNENVGIAVENLNDLDSILSDITVAKYEIYKSNAIKISHKLSNGFYIRNIINKL